MTPVCSTRSLPEPRRTQSAETRAGRRVAVGFARFMLGRAIAVLLTVAAGLYAAIWVSGLGGYSDELRRADIRADIVMSTMRITNFESLSIEERQEMLYKMYEVAYAAADLDKPFYQRSVRYLVDALTLSLGKSDIRARETGSDKARDVVLESLPLTVLLFVTANLVTFFGSLFCALALSRRYGSILDRVATLLVPLLSAPPWFHGIFLIVIFASVAKILPYGGVVDVPPPETTVAYLLSLLKHMILPVLAWVLGTMPFALYANRAFFMIHSKEDYVDMAVAKGLRRSRIQSRHILRPALPPVITSFAFTLIMAWQGAVLTEYVFGWPGVGSLLLQAIREYDVSVVMGTVAIFAYLLAATVLSLDIVYALIDPRVRLGAKEGT
jgi:peptide/nickel transport system permease protein